MWKYLFAILVSAGVIAGGRYFYLHRHELFRPDFDATGGTLLVFETDGEPPAGALDELLDVLQKRFDPGKSAGIVVRIDEEGRIEVGVPLGKQHDDLVASVKRLAMRPGVVEFRMIANRSDDEAVLKVVEAPVKKAKLDAPPRPPLNAHGGEEFPVTRPIAPTCRYRWIALSEAQVRSMRLDRLGLTHENPMDQVKVEDSTRKGVPFAPTFMADAIMQARLLPKSTDPAFFLLVREPAENEQTRAGALENARASSARGRSSISFRLSPTGSNRLSELLQNNGARPNGVLHWQVMVLLDGEALAAPIMGRSNRRDLDLFGEFSISDTEDLAVLLRGGTLPCRLKFLREFSMSKKR
jgi:preprotein translocase subunit SecD